MANGTTGWLVAVASLVACATASGQDESPNVQRLLDRPVQLDVKDATIPKVLADLSAQTNVKFVVVPETYEYLPYADQTRLAVTLKNVTLRKALGPMLTPQGLQWALDGNAVRISPADALFRICRRVTYDELKLLGAIRSVKLQAADTSEAVLAQLRKATGNKELHINWAHVKVDPAALCKRAARVLPNTAEVWLDTVCHMRGLTWYLWGDAIMIVDKKAQVERQLARHVSLRYSNADLARVILEVVHKARLKLAFAPGVMNRVSPRALTNFNLVMSDASIAEALEVIGGATGLEFLRTADGIRVAASDELKARAGAATTQPRQRPPFLIRMSVPVAAGIHVEVFLRGDELPAEIVEAIQARKARMIEQLRKELAEKPRPKD